MRVVLVEPPKDFWFIMGQYIAPPFGLLYLAAASASIVLLVSIYIVKTLEEPRLFDRFGEEYNLYRKKTSFLFPNWNKLFQGYIIQYITERWNQILYIFLAELSLLITILIVFNQKNDLYSFSLQGITSSILFAMICILGIIAGIAPNWFSFGSRSERRGVNGVTGHHPDCGRFLGHIVRFMDKTYCAGCSGLVLGAFTALLGLIINFYGLFTHDSVLVFWVGALFVSLGLAQHFIDLGLGWVHFWLNFWFVVGAWFMFEGIQQLNTSFLVTLYFLILTLFWIFARIRLSQFTHVRTCNDCFDVCELRFE